MTRLDRVLHTPPSRNCAERMLWTITIPVLLAGVLCITGETRRHRPHGYIPSPYKTKGNLSSVRHHRLLHQKPEVLSSSREALVVTEGRYLRRDWCKTQPLRQTISEEGCRSRTVVNRFCYGQCNSFYIPRHLGPQNRGHGSGRKGHNKAQEPFQSCSFCRPHRVTQLTVQLDCPDLQPPFRHRKVQRVKQCRCMSVEVNGHGKL
ncbi:gremlin-2-like isoform X1 [Nerophis lumbriciformis]|uniref:gremlin-2-like isoform X1 n=1 Tax=Nerophis lumbriciformis TaxID=546530 RepID=UPI002ADF42DC|nr:gremlin-2-like isoform X1 [Nerophis lumbriciformis]